MRGSAICKGILVRAACAIVAVFAVGLGCNAGDEELELTIFYSADISGYLEPCG